MERVRFDELRGKTVASITGLEMGSDSVYFFCDDGTSYLMSHGLLSTPILSAEESTNRDSHPDGWRGLVDDSYTWTFYKIETSKGGITIRWLGESNGYYSEAVDFERVR